jgi:hypothetical protein
MRVSAACGKVLSARCRAVSGVVADEGFFRFSAELSGEIRRIFPGKIRSAAEVCSHPVRNKPQRPAGFGLEQIHFWCRAALKGHGFSRAAKYGKISGL